MADRYIGLMSGTSLDGVDAVLVDFEAIGVGQVDVLAADHRPFDPALAAELLALNDPGGTDELHRAALAGNALARLYAEAVAAVLSQAGLAADDVAAIGAHGQTVRHRPGEFDGTGYTLQLGNAALLAELTGIDVVDDLRSRDLAAGGQGAPLVPAFHRAVFGRPGTTTAVLNLGGIANLTVLGREPDDVLGFDCGPANVLMDHWCRLHTGAPYDLAGRWAASGQIVPPLLASMRADPYFAAAPPKSTGRDRFHAGWLAAALQSSQGVNESGVTERAAQTAPIKAQSAAVVPSTASICNAERGRFGGPSGHVGFVHTLSALAAAADVQATLAELTATTCAEDVHRFAAGADRLLVCGGGAANDHLMGRLAALLPGIEVVPTERSGLPATQVEATAFAWLARAFCRRDPGNRIAVTGARGARVLGSLSPAH